MEQHVDKLFARGKPDTSQEERNPQFAKRDIGVIRHVKYDRSQPAKVTKNNRCQEWSSRQSKLHWRRNCLEMERPASQEDSKRDADKHADKARVVQLLGFIADHGCDLLEASLRPDHLQQVAKLEFQVRSSGHLYAGPGHTRDRHIVALGKIERLQ